MLNAPFDGPRPNLPLITALTARYSLHELNSHHVAGTVVTVYYYPDGKGGRARVWKGTLNADVMYTIRRLIGIARGRQDVYSTENQGPPSWLQHLDCPKDRQLQAEMKPILGQVRDGYDRIQTFKWTTDGTTHRKLPPNTLVWRDLYSGKVYVRHPEDEQVAM